MYALCAGMRWAHLPAAGGIYNQSPDFVEMIQYIMRMQNEAERKKQAQREREAEAKVNRGRGPRPRRGRGLAGR